MEDILGLDNEDIKATIKDAKERMENNKVTLPTVDELLDDYGDNPHGVWKYLDDFQGRTSYPSKPPEPRLKDKSQDGIAIYAAEMLQYEKDLENYKAKKKTYETLGAKIYILFQEYCIEDLQVKKYVPEKKWDKIWDLANQYAEGEGMPWRHHRLAELVELFHD